MSSSDTIGNIEVATGHSGTVYGYVLGDNAIVRTLISPSTDTVATTSLSVNKITTNYQLNLAAAADPESFPGDDGAPTDRVHIFFQVAGTGNIYYVRDTCGTSLGALTPQSVLVGGQPLSMPGGFSAVAHPHGIVLVGAKDPTTIQTVAIPWTNINASSPLQDLSAQSWSLSGWIAGATNQSLNVASGNHDCDVRACLGTVISSPTGGVAGDAQMYLCVLLRTTGSNGTSSVQALQLTALDVDDRLVIGANWSPAKNTWAATLTAAPALKFPQFTLQPDGNLLAHAFQVTGWTVFSHTARPDDLLTFLTAAGTTLPDKTDPSVVTTLSTMQQGSSISPAPEYGSNACALVYSLGADNPTLSPQNPALTDTTRALSPTVVYWSGTESRVWKSGTLWGYLSRTGTVSITGSWILLGIVEGPPPLPQQNLQIPSSLSTYNYMSEPGMSRLVYGVEVTKENSLSIEWTGGFTFAAKVSVTATAQVPVGSAKGTGSAGYKVALTYRGAYKSVKTETVLSTTEISSKMKQDPTTKVWSLFGLGGLIFAKPTWTSYIYEVLGPDNNVRPDSLSYVQVFPQAPEFASDWYEIPPNHVTPGDLTSYVLSPAEQAALVQGDVCQFATGNNLAASWSPISLTTSKATSSSQSTWDHGFNGSVQAWIGAHGEKEGSFLGLFSAKISYDVNFELNGSYGMKWSTTQRDTQIISMTFGVRGNVEAPNSYTAYGFNVYQFTPAAQWGQELLSTLVTPTFPPPGSHARDHHQKLLNRINPGSAPWKIVYTIDPDTLEFNGSLSDYVAHASPAVARGAGWLQARGATVVQHARNLLGAARDGVDTWPRNVSWPADAAAAQALVDEVHADAGARADLEALVDAGRVPPGA